METNSRGIQGIDGFRQIQTEVFPRIQVARLGDQPLGKGGILCARWHRPEWHVSPGYNYPCDTAWPVARADRPRCRAGFRDTSTVQMPRYESVRGKAASEPGDRRHSGRRFA